ncbi:MAG: GNAT family N-acetyltransferase [Treponema sp.]|nr:GNAT family N-acetyltransferase [Treponema sp.]
MVIRLMTIDDYEKVLKLWDNTQGMGTRTTDDSQAGIKKFLKRNPRTCFVAHVAGPGKGELAGVILSGHDGRRGYIYHTAVQEEFRWQNIGALLVKKVEEALAGEGINKVALVAFKSNENGNQFWENQGYTQPEDLVYRNKSLNEKNETI